MEIISKVYLSLYIAQAIAKYQTIEYPTNDLMYYFNVPDNKYLENRIKQKINSACLTVESSGNELYAALKLDMNKDLSVEELKVFIEQIELQYRDGWGSSFEMENIPTSGKDLICLRLSTSEMAFYTGDSFQELITNTEIGYEETNSQSWMDFN